MNALSTASPSFIAVSVTMHIGLALLQWHRSAQQRHQRPLLLLPSLVLVVTPWLLPTSFAIISGLAVHALWTKLTDRLVPAQSRATAIAGGGQGNQRQPQPARPIPATSSQLPTNNICDSAPVIAVIEESEDTKTIRFARPTGFDFEAGQFVTVGVVIDGSQVNRCYTISSSPQAKGYLEITVKRQGLVSGALHTTVAPGSLLSLRPPAGEFTYPSDDGRAITLIAGGVGITPMMSMLRHAANNDPNRAITLFYSARTTADIVFADELKWMSRRFPRFRIVMTTTASPGEDGRPPRRIDRQMILDNLPRPSDCIFMICGPEGMIEAIGKTLRDLDVPDSQIRQEAFAAAVAGPPRASSTGPSPNHQLTVAGRTFAAPADRTLLDSAEDCGVELVASCRAGMCGMCRCQLVAGEVSCEGTALSEADIQSGAILPCVAWPLSDCTIEP